MSIDIHSWLEEARAKLLDAFGQRLRFIGIQGSYGRDEATDHSDIDLVVILDTVGPDDWRIYRALLSGLPHSELACGFFSGTAELARWDRADLFQFVHDTTPLLGDLSALTPPIGREDAARALRRAACDLYHVTGHNLLHGRSVSVLAAQFKSAAFALRAKCWLETGTFYHRTDELRTALSEGDRAVLDGGAGLNEENLDERSQLLLTWASNIIQEVDQ